MTSPTVQIPVQFSDDCKNQKFKIIDYEIPNSDEYIVLESISASVAKIVHVVNMKKSS